MLESGAPIIPVFYHVKPAELQQTRCREGWFAQVIKNIPWLHQDGIYASALRDLKRKWTYDPQTQRKKPRYDPGTLEKWSSALSRAANISGLELEACNGCEAELVEKIEQQVVKFVREAPFAQPTYLIGLNNWLNEFKRTISQEQQLPGEAKVVGISGSGGMGKSTTAKEFFNRNKSDYDRSSYLFNVKKGPLIDLQKKLVKDLISRDLKIDNIADGMAKLSRHLRDCQALIVLDDVDNVRQLNALLSPVRAVLHPDSLILVITRNKNILSGFKESPIYEMKRLSAEQSKELFCLHAFHQPRPVAGFEEIVGAFLVNCTGLPLSLKVFGALLRGNDLGYWKHQLCKISNVFPAGIHRWTLLDIACLFLLGEDTKTSIKILEGSEGERSLALLNLQKKKCCLIDQKYLTMHHQSRDLCIDRSLAHQETPVWGPAALAFTRQPFSYRFSTLC